MPAILQYCMCRVLVVAGVLLVLFLVMCCKWVFCAAQQLDKSNNNTSDTSNDDTSDNDTSDMSNNDTSCECAIINGIIIWQSWRTNNYS